MTFQAGGTINVANDTTAQIVNLANGAAVKTTTLGSTNGASATTIQGGSGDIKLDSQSGTDGNITLIAGSNVNVTGDLVDVTSTTGDIDLHPAAGFRVDIDGDLNVSGTTTTTSTEIATLLLQDNYIHANTGYLDDAAEKGGATVRYDPTTTTDTANGAFDENVGVSTVITTGSVTFAVGDIIAVDNANDLDNDGLYEVLTHVGTTLTINSTPGENFLKIAFVDDVTVAGDITKVNLAIIQADTSGDWEVGKGSSVTTPAITFSKLALIGPGTAIATNLLVRGSGTSIQGSAITVTNDKALEVTGGTLSLGANADAHGVTMGSLTGTSATLIQSGSGDITLDSNSGTDGDITLDSGLTVGIEALGMINVATTTTTQTVNVGTGAGVKTTNVGSINTTSVTTLQSGSGGTDITSTENITLTPGIDPGEEVFVVGSMDIQHTALEADDHALEIEINAAGFGDVRAIDIPFTTGAIVAGQDEEAILVNIDQSASTGGRIVALEVIGTTTGTAEIDGMECGVACNPILHQSGVFGNADFLENDLVTLGTELDSGNPATVSVFLLDNETFVVGQLAKFTEIEIIHDTFASGAGIAPTFAYWDGVAYVAFTPIDGTNGMRNNGVIIWELSDIPGWMDDGTHFLIEITRTRNMLSTTPIWDLLQVSETTLFSWDKNGDVIVNDVTAAALTATGVVDFNTATSFDLVATADTATAVKVFATGGTTSELHVENTTGTAADAVRIDSALGGIDIDAALQVNIASSQASTEAILFNASDGGGGIKIQQGGTDRIATNSTGIGFFNETPIAKPTITGERDANPALADLLTDLASFGLITDSTTVGTGGGGGGGGLVSRDFEASDFLNPGSSSGDWAKDTLAPHIVDPTDPAIGVRAFDGAGSLEEGVGFQVFMPATSANIKIVVTHRRATGSGAANINLNLHVRPITGTVGSFVEYADATLSGLLLAAPTAVQYATDTIVDEDFTTNFAPDLLASTFYQFELVRDAVDAADTLNSVDWYLANLHVEITA